jgi:hypothetical protein
VDETAALLGEPFAGYAGAFVRTTTPHMFVSARFVKTGVMA